jgi:hypothetical protein
MAAMKHDLVRKIGAIRAPFAPKGGETKNLRAKFSIGGARQQESRALRWAR